MEDISLLKADIDSKLEREMTNLSVLQDSLSKSNTNTQNMLSILSTFEGRLKKLEDTIVPVYHETENLRRRQENIEKTAITLENVLGYYHVAKDVELHIKEGPNNCGLDKYLAQMDRLQKALNYFNKHNLGSLELTEVIRIYDDGKEALINEFRSLLSRHGRPVPPVLILDLLGSDEELQPGETDIFLEHLPEKVITELSEISRWLVSNGNNTDFLKDYMSRRSTILVKSLQSLKEHLKSSSGNSATFAVQHSPAVTAKFRPAKDTPARRSMKRLAHITKKAIIKSPFDQGHRRQTASTDVIREEISDLEIDIYITSLTALLKLMQSEMQLMLGIIPEKHQRTTFDSIIQQGLDQVVTEGENLASNARKNIGRHEFTAVISIFPVVRHLRTIKSDFDLTMEGCQVPTRSKLASLLSTLGSTGAKALEEFIESIKNDPDKASNMPRDGTVHELTNGTIIFLEHLQEYADTAGAMLLMHGEQAAPSEAVDSKKSKLKLADFITRVLSALGLNLSNKSETYSDPTLRPVFMLNNYHYILKSLKRSGLLDIIHLWNKDVEVFYDQQIMEQKKKYSESWSKVLQYILEMNAPISVQRTLTPDAKLKEKEKQNIKDKFTGFNKEFEDILRIQKGYAIPDMELRETLKKDNRNYIAPLYKMFLEKYVKLNFTKNPDKYMKYSVEDVGAMIDKFFDTSA